MPDNTIPVASHDSVFMDAPSVSDTLSGGRFGGLRCSAVRGHSPDGIRQIVRHDECAARIHAHPYRPAAGHAVAAAEPVDEVDRRAIGAASAKRHENHLVTDRVAAVPAPVLAHEYTVGE